MDQTNNDDGSCASRMINKEGIVLLDRQIRLSNGTRCHVLSSQPTSGSTLSNNNNNESNSSPQVPFRPPPLLFLHGTFHSAWCWKEHFFPFFVSLGHTVIAISWRGTSKTHSKDDLEDSRGSHTTVEGKKFIKKKKKIKISDHVDDLECVMEQLQEIVSGGLDQRQDDKVAIEKRNFDDHNNTNNQDTINTTKPILICHSFGGIIAMKYFESLYERDRKRPGDIVSGIVSLCSVPPSGLNPMIFRSMWKSFVHTWKVIKGIPMKQATTDPILCRYLFFDHGSSGMGGNSSPSSGDEHVGSNDFGISDADLARYQEHFLQDSRSVIDVGHLAKNVPSKKVNSKGQSKMFVSDGGLPAKPPPPILVVAARDDKIVDMEGNIETSLYYGLTEEDLIAVDSPHDVMLGRNWRETADVIRLWLEQHNFSN